MRLLLPTVLLLLLAAIVHAAVPATLVEALRPLDGVLVKPDGGDYLIDLGSNAGLRDGDLLTVLAPGAELRHPTTGKVIGRLDQRTATLRVVRLKPDFAWVRLLEGTTPATGAAIRRFGETPALFSGTGEADHLLFNELQLALPHLAWLPWGSRELSGAGLRFARTDTALTVHDQDGTLLGRWPLAPDSAPPAPPATVAAPPAATAPPPTATLSAIEQRFSGKGRGVAIADLDGDGRQDVAVGLDHRIEIGRLTGRQWQALQRYELPLALTLLTLDASDLDGDGKSELLVTAVRGEQLAAQIVACSAQECRPLAEGLPWYLRVVDLPGRGPVPLAQLGGTGYASDYYQSPFEIGLNAGRVVAGTPVTLPPGLNLHGMQPFVSGTTAQWAFLDGSDRLAVTTAGGDILWSSRERFGGGESFIDKADPNKKRAEGRRFYLPARLGRAGETLLVPQNLGDTSFSQRRRADRSRLVALRWDGLTLTPLWSTPECDGTLADFARADLDGNGRDDYLLLVSRAGGLFDQPVTTLSLWQP